MSGIPFIQPIIDQIHSWVFTDESAYILVGIFAVVIAVSFYGATRIEEN